MPDPDLCLRPGLYKPRSTTAPRESLPYDQPRYEEARRPPRVRPRAHRQPARHRAPPPPTRTGSRAASRAGAAASALRAAGRTRTTPVARVVGPRAPWRARPDDRSPPFRRRPAGTQCTGSRLRPQPPASSTPSTGPAGADSAAVHNTAQPQAPLSSSAPARRTASGTAGRRPVPERAMPRPYATAMPRPRVAHPTARPRTPPPGAWRALATRGRGGLRTSGGYRLVSHVRAPLAVGLGGAELRRAPRLVLSCQSRPEPRPTHPERVQRGTPAPPRSAPCRAPRRPRTAGGPTTRRSRPHNL